jgi:hypothetical protein
MMFVISMWDATAGSNNDKEDNSNEGKDEEEVDE